MNRLRPLCAALLVALLLSACDPFEDDSSTLGGGGQTAPGTPVSAGTDSAERIALGADTLTRGLMLLGEHYVGGVEPSELLAASQRGAWSAIAQSGVLPRDVDLPPDQAGLSDSLTAFRTRYTRTATRYASKIDPVWLSNQMLRQAADSLDDCHTGFLSARQVSDQAQRMSGSTQFGGVGVIIRRAPDNVSFLIVEVFDGGPAATAGLQPGDRLLSVDDQILAGMGIEQVVQLVRGAEGSTVKLGVQRGGSTLSGGACIVDQYMGT